MKLTTTEIKFLSNYLDVGITPVNFYYCNHINITFKLIATPFNYIISKKKKNCK